MNIKKLNAKLADAYDNKVQAELNEHNKSIIVSGELDSWEDIVAACSMCVNKKNDWHVVNHIKFTGAKIPPMRLPELKDDALEGATPDVLIVGGGVCGCAIARELSRWDLGILLIDKESDVAVQASSRNDGEVHPGVDQKSLTLKLKYELRGNAMYPQICKELGVKFRYVGQYVAFKGRYLKPLMEFVSFQRHKLGVKDTEILGKDELYAAQPNLNPGYDIGLYNPSAGEVCPYGLTIAYAENAIQNGANVSLNTAVLGMDVEEGVIKTVHTNRGDIKPRLVINAAGVWSDKLAAMADDEFFSIHPRRGTEAVLDHKAAGITDAIISYKELFNKTEKHTKGGGILHTVDDNILVGPDAIETYERENYATHPESIEWLFNKQKKTIESLDRRDIITYFTGVRAANFEEDFIIEEGRETSNIIHCAAIQSPGLTAAPAIAVDIAEMAVSKLGNVKPNNFFNPIRKPIPSLKDLSEDERARLINENPDYGVIVCRCEEISKGEILDALRSPLCVPTLDGIKRRVRPGMGRCQGGFCGPSVSKIIAEFMDSEISEVTKSGNNSYISYGRTK